MRFTFNLASEMVDGPTDEDGETIVLLMWFVLAEDDKGRRWTYDGPGGQWDPSQGNEPPPGAEDLRSEFESQKIDPSKNTRTWAEDLPMYGSEAWDDKAEFKLACEEADALGALRPQR